MKNHIPIEKIVDLANGRLTPEESLALLDRIEQDKEASRLLDAAAELAGTVQRDGAELFRREEPPKHIRRSWLAHPVAAAVAACIVGVTVVALLLPARSPYAALASLDEFDLAETVRGVELDDLNAALNLYGAGQYDESIRLFERYLRAYPHGDLSGYAHYSSGACFLKSARREILGIYTSFDQERVTKGLEHLQEALGDSADGRLQTDAQWLLIKGHLMAGDRQKAVQELQTVVRMGGSWRVEAAGILSVLNK